MPGTDLRPAWPRLRSMTAGIAGRVDAGVDHGGAGPGQRVRQRRGQVPFAGHRGARGAHRGRGGRERDRAVPDRLLAALPGRALLDLDQAERGVVEDDHDDPQRQPDGRLDLGQRHAQAAVAGEREHRRRAACCAQRGGDRGGQRVAHGGQAAGDQQPARLGHLPQRHRHQHVRARIHGGDGLGRRAGPCGRDDLLRGQPSRRRHRRAASRGPRPAGPPGPRPAATRARAGGRLCGQYLGRRAARSASASTARLPGRGVLRRPRLWASTPPGRRCRLIRRRRQPVSRPVLLGRGAVVHVRDDRAGRRGQRRPQTACAAARGPETVTAALATDRPSAVWSIRWWLIRPASAAATVSAITTTGSRSSAACAMPLTALASPGPRVTTTDPGAPVRSALVAAMIVAAVSPWARTKRSPAAAAAPTTSRLGPPPGTPNISRVPALASAATIARRPPRGRGQCWLPMRLLV